MMLPVSAIASKLYRSISNESLEKVSQNVVKMIVSRIKLPIVPNGGFFRSNQPLTNTLAIYKYFGKSLKII